MSTQRWTLNSLDISQVQQKIDRTDYLQGKSTYPNSVRTGAAHWEEEKEITNISTNDEYLKIFINSFFLQSMSSEDSKGMRTLQEKA